MVPKKIGLAGKSGSGKDVIADHICDKFSYRKIAVADAIRDECSQFLGLALGMEGKRLAQCNEFYPSTKPFSQGGEPFPLNLSGFSNVVESFQKMIWEKPTPSGIRVLLQWYGTEFRRTQDPDYWVKRLAERLNNDELIVVSDVRTPDEVKAIHEAGGEVWYVERPGVGSVGIQNHYTEVALEGATFDRTIMNDGTLENLLLKVNWIFREC